MTKLTKWVCTQRRLRSAWVSPSLIWVFTVGMKKAWAFSFPLKAQRRLWSDWADAGCIVTLLAFSCRGLYKSCHEKTCLHGSSGWSAPLLLAYGIRQVFTWHGLYMDRVKRIWYLSPMRAAKVQASLRIRAVSPEPSLLAHTSSESRGTFRQKARSLAPLNGWACAVEICHDGMLEDTNSLDAAHMVYLVNEGSVWTERVHCLPRRPSG